MRTRAEQSRPVVAFDDDGAQVAEPGDLGADHVEPGGRGGPQAQVLVEVVLVEACDGGLEDVRGGPGAVQEAPAVAGPEEGGLGLGAGQAEPAGEVGPEPGRRVLLQLPQPIGHLVVAQPGDVVARRPGAVGPGRAHG